MEILVRFEVLTSVVMNSTIFWDITPCIELKINWLIFPPEDGGNMFLRNISWL
jgi:hypothetical protein